MDSSYVTEIPRIPCPVSVDEAVFLVGTFFFFFACDLVFVLYLVGGLRPFNRLTTKHHRTFWTGVNTTWCRVLFLGLCFCFVYLNGIISGIASRLRPKSSVCGGRGDLTRAAVLLSVAG